MVAFSAVILSYKMPKEKTLEPIAFLFSLALCALQGFFHLLTPPDIIVSIALNMLLILGFYLVFPIGILWQIIPAIILAIEIMEDRVAYFC